MEHTAAFQQQSEQEKRNEDGLERGLLRYGHPFILMWHSAPSESGWGGVILPEDVQSKLPQLDSSDIEDKIIRRPFRENYGTSLAKDIPSPRALAEKGVYETVMVLPLTKKIRAESMEKVEKRKWGRTIIEKRLVSKEEIVLATLKDFGMTGTEALAQDRVFGIYYEATAPNYYDGTGTRPFNNFISATLCPTGLMKDTLKPLLNNPIFIRKYLESVKEGFSQDVKDKWQTERPPWEVWDQQERQKTLLVYGESLDDPSSPLRQEYISFNTKGTVENAQSYSASILSRSPILE